MPTGGTAGQVLAKTTGADFDTAWIAPPEGGGGGGGWVRETTTHTTPSLVVGAHESGVLALAASYRLLRVTTDKPARVRLYTTPAKRDADLDRAIGVKPTGDHGRIGEFITTTELPGLDCSPLVDGQVTAGTSSVPFSIVNTGTAGTITLTLTWIRTEQPMPTAVMTSTWHNTTDASFREWGKAISDGITAVGLTKVPDAGTIDWASVAKAATNNAAAGFEIWRFSDPLQATHPVFIKIEYGCQQGVTTPGTWVTVGRGSDGLGNITGVLAPRRQTQANTASSSLTQSALLIEPIYISSDGSSLCVVPRTTAGANASRVGVVIVDRSRDSAGTPTATGGLVLTEGVGSGGVGTGGTGSAEMHTWSFSGEYAMGPVPAVAPAYVNSTAGISAFTSLASGDKAPVFPYIAVLPNHAPWQALAAVGIMAGDAANGPFTANVLGSVRSYRSIRVGDAHCRWMTSGAGASGYTGVCILWEE